MSAWLLHPEGLGLLLLAPAVWLLLALRGRARRRRLGRAVGPRVAQLAGGAQRRRRGLRRLAYVGGLFCALLALLGPAWGAPERALTWRGADVVLCLDVSRSMLARDLLPDRLGRAQEQIRAFTEATRGDRLALVLFAGEARLRVPLTRDVGAVAALAAAADPSSVERGGTDLGAALTVALGALEAGDERPRAIVLLTDGEDLGGRGAKMTATCVARGVAVHTVGLGTRAGSPIVLSEGGARTVVRDGRGAEVVSAMDAAALRRIARATDGMFVEARTSATPLVDLYRRAVLPRARAASSGGAGGQPANRFQGPLLAAFLLFMLDLWLVDRRRR